MWELQLWIFENFSLMKSPLMSRVSLASQNIALVPWKGAVGKCVKGVWRYHLSGFQHFPLDQVVFLFSGKCNYLFVKSFCAFGSFHYAHLTAAVLDLPGRIHQRRAAAAAALPKMQKFPVSICYCKKCFVQSWALTEAFEPEATGVLPTHYKEWLPELPLRISGFWNSAPLGSESFSSKTWDLKSTLLNMAVHNTLCLKCLENIWKMIFIEFQPVRHKSTQYLSCFFFWVCWL